MGASARSVLGLVLGQGMRLVAAGLALGILIAFGVSGALRTMLFDVDPRDITVFAAVPVVLAMVGALACYLPARRATQVDPVIALRND
jgi:ABC-type antimicrobial peptide transport system permease subunit